MNRQDVAMLKYSTRVLSVTRDALCGKGWKSPQTWALVSSRRKTTSCAFAWSCRFFRAARGRRTVLGRLVRVRTVQPGCALRSAVPGSSRCRLPLAALCPALLGEEGDPARLRACLDPALLLYQENQQSGLLLRLWMETLHSQRGRLGFVGKTVAT